MPNVQSFYQMAQTVFPVFDFTQSPFTGGVVRLTNKYGATTPVALLHLNLQGIVANDLSYITNIFSVPTIPTSLIVGHNPPFLNSSMKG